MRNPLSLRIADKVLNLIKGKNLFIGICTRKEAAIDVANLSRGNFKRKSLTAPEERFASKTSDWIIQEIGLANGLNVDLILLLEDGLRRPGGLQGDLEYIQFERNAPEKAFGKLLEMIQALRPKAKSVFVPEQEKSAAVEEPLRKEQKTVAEWLEPKESWHKQDYEIAVCHMIATGDTDGEKRIADAFFATNGGQIESNRLAWEAQGEHLHLEVGKGGTLAKLNTLARSHQENSDVHWYLGRGYEKYSEHERAAKCYSVAAERTNDTNVQLRSLGAAALAFLKEKKRPEPTSYRNDERHRP